MALGPELDVQTIKKDFPILDQKVNGHRAVYLDSAASSQKPTAVLAAMTEYYETTHANVHRGVYAWAEEATARYEASRGKVRRFIGGASDSEVIYTKNVTEAINLVSNAWGRANLRAGDAVLLTEMEHHANLVPWLMLKESLGIELRYLPLGEDGQLDLSDLDRLVDGVKLVGVTAMSNVLGTITPVRRIADAAHAAGALVLVDGAQYVPHLPTDVAALGADFFAFTGHKMLGPTGIGVLWGRSRAARRHAAVPRWRRHDPGRPARRVHAERAALEVRGGHAADRRGHRARRGHRLPAGARHGRRPHATRSR